MHLHDMPLLNIHLQNPTFKSDKRKPSVNKTTPLPPSPFPLPPSPFPLPPTLRNAPNKKDYFQQRLYYMLDILQMNSLAFSSNTRSLCLHRFGCFLLLSDGLLLLCLKKLKCTNLKSGKKEFVVLSATCLQICSIKHNWHF